MENQIIEIQIDNQRIIGTGVWHWCVYSNDETWYVHIDTIKAEASELLEETMMRKVFDDQVMCGRYDDELDIPNFDAYEYLCSGY